MPEIWETPFGNAFLKIERANKHITDFQERLDSSIDAYGPRLNMDGNTGEQFLYYGLSDRKLRSDIALIVGDAIHNLRCALDFAWGGALATFDPKLRTRFNKFPIDPGAGRQHYEIKHTNAGKTPAPMLDLILNRVKCYSGGDSDILALQTFDIDDKHRVLIPMITVTGIKGVELKNEDATIDVFDIVIARRLETYRRVVPLETKIQKHGHATFKVTFGDGTPLEGVDILPALRRMSAKVHRIVHILQRMRPEMVEEGGHPITSAHRDG